MNWGRAAPQDVSSSWSSMGPLMSVLQVLVLLLEAAVYAHHLDCSDSENWNCELVAVTGEIATVRCGTQTVKQRETSEINNASNSTLTGHSITTTRKVFNINSTNGYFLTLDEELLNSTSFNYSEPISYDMTGRSGSNDDTRRDLYNFIKRNSSSGDIHLHLWPTIVVVQVNLTENIPLLDLSLFPNAKNITLHTNGYTLPKVCGVGNVIYLKIASPKLENASFIYFFKGLLELNLSDSGIKEFPVNGLPPWIVSLDLSYNNIIFDKNINLPEQLRVFNVSFNEITNVDSFSINGNVVVLDIRGNRLTYVPVLEASTIQELYLSANNISSLNRNVFKTLTSLTVLDLKRNRLTSLEERVFQGLNKLQVLDMSENDVITLAPATFQYLNNLVILSVSGNINLGSLQNVKDSSFLFGTGQRLQVIDASKTNLTRVPPTLTRSVKKLLLAHNSISSIQCGELDSFPLLQDMDVSNNTISEVEEDALGRLDNLFSLNLSGNKLNSTPKSLPGELQTLDLRCNFVVKLNNYDFLGLPKLRILLLSRNKITVVEDGAFGQLSSLEVLDLSHNPIKTLSRTSFVGPRKLKEMYLVSLSDLIPLRQPLSFPAPESAHLEVLNIDSSPVLARQLMDDVAALTMFHELFELNLNHCRLSTLRSDLPKYLPRLYKLELTGNVFNCTNIIWLVNWLQSLNISMNDKVKFQRGIYNLKDICCEGSDIDVSFQEARAICASPDYLSGKEIITLREEDFPDLKLTSSSLPPVRQDFFGEHFVRQTFVESSKRISPSSLNGNNSLSKQTLSIRYSNYNTSTIISRIESTTPFSSVKTSTNETQLKSLQTKTINKLLSLENSNDKELKISKDASYTNWETKRWKYIKSETKYRLSSANTVSELLNETLEQDPQLSSRAYLSEQHHPQTSHPGMVVFLLVISMLLVAASVTVYSQSRRSREYRRHQDIEVSNFGGNELW